MADSGIYKDSKGRKVIDVTLGEAVAKAVGFQPKSVAETQEATATEQNLIGQNRAMKERLTADMAQAVYDKDVERQAEIRERQQAWNRRNPESPVFIDRRSCVAGDQDAPDQGRACCGSRSEVHSRERAAVFGGSARGHHSPLMRGVGVKIMRPHTHCPGRAVPTKEPRCPSHTQRRRPHTDMPQPLTQEGLQHEKRNH
jgi:hypothetical protein